MVCLALGPASALIRDPAESDASDPEGTIDLSGFDPIDHAESFSTQTDQTNNHVYKIFVPPPGSTAATTKSGSLREFRYHASNTADGVLIVTVMLLKEVPNTDNMLVTFHAVQAQVGREDEEFWIEQLTAESWHSTNGDRVLPGMLLATSVEASCTEQTDDIGVSYEFGTPDVCGTTFTYTGVLHAGSIIPKSQLFANQDDRCMVASIQVVVDL